MRIFNETEILDQDFRALVIKEIESAENLTRKNDAKKRYDIYKDRTKNYVLDMLNDESDDKKALREVVHRAANISFAKEIIEKKAMVYKDPAERTVVDGSDDVQTQVDNLYNLLNLDKKMKQANKYEELFKNALVGILPFDDALDPTKQSLCVRVYQPYLYDVIEDGVNHEIARALIFSYYAPQGTAMQYGLQGQSGVRESPKFHGNMAFGYGNGRDETIADTPSDKGSNKKHYIWWSKSYHFTTDEKGEIIQGERKGDMKNPIGYMPFVNFSQDQDGEFWAIGGDDIIDGAVLLNLLLTDLFYIAKYQGMGLAYAFGRGLPDNLKVGPSSLLVIDMEEGDPTPQVGFATSNPPIDAHLSMIKEYLSFLLMTNKLQPSSGNVEISKSGVHEMIKNSQNMNDIEDQKELYRDNERLIFEIIKRWLNLLLTRNAACDEIKEIGRIPETAKVKVDFKVSDQVVSEIEELEIIQKRVEMGLDTKLDAIKRDNPELTDAEAEAKYRKILEEKIKESRDKLTSMGVFNAGQNNSQSRFETSDQVEGLEKNHTGDESES